MTDLGAVVREGLGTAVMAVVPLVAAGLAGSAAAGWLGGRVGLTDPVAIGVLRGLAVLGALVLVGDALAEQAVTLVDQSWSGLATAGRGTP